MRAGAHHRPDAGDAFLPDPLEEGPLVVSAGAVDPAEDLAEKLGEEYVVAATANVAVPEQHFEEPDADLDAYLDVPAGREFADDVDAANPADATREPFPMAVHGATMPPNLGGRSMESAEDTIET
jgi:hypothetical protein